MIKRLPNISLFPEEVLPFLTDKEVYQYYNKGWSFSNIYYLKPIRDIYLIIKKNKTEDLNNKFIRYEYLKITEDLSKEWSERKILEYVNAIKNFGLINGNYKVQKNIFINSALGNKLSDEDLQDFKDIFFEFFRFKEIATWYLISDSKKQLDINEVTIPDLIEKSRLMYAIKEDKFFNKFLFSLEDVSKVYVIPPKDSHLMRFIEVFYKWGTTLNFIEKFNLNSVNIKTFENREITCTYFIRPFKNFDLMKFTQKHFQYQRQISLPELIFSICQNFHYAVDEIKSFLINEIQFNDKFTYERTSAVFIVKGKNKSEQIKSATYLYPLIDNSYVSHIIVRK